MKKIYTTIIVLMFAMAISEAQSISNTTWAVYDPSNTLFKYFEFGNDTLYESSDNVTYYARSTYQVNGDAFKIKDIQSSSCGLWVGEYTFSIYSNTLHFYVISDGCPTGRSAVFTGDNWESISTGISQLNPPTKLNIFPSPANTVLNIHLSTPSSSTRAGQQLIITDLLGNEVYKKVLIGIDNTISISTWNEGIYFYEVRSDNSSQRGKFIKE